MTTKTKFSKKGKPRRIQIKEVSRKTFPGLASYVFSKLKKPMKAQNQTFNYAIGKSSSKNFLPICSSDFGILVPVVNKYHNLYGHGHKIDAGIRDTFLLTDALNHFSSLGLMLGDAETIQRGLYNKKKIYINEQNGNMLIGAKLYKRVFNPFFHPERRVIRTEERKLYIGEHIIIRLKRAAAQIPIKCVLPKNTVVKTTNYSGKVEKLTGKVTLTKISNKINEIIDFLNRI